MSIGIGTTQPRTIGYRWWFGTLLVLLAMITAVIVARNLASDDTRQTAPGVSSVEKVDPQERRGDFHGGQVKFGRASDPLGTNTPTEIAAGVRIGAANTAANTPSELNGAIEAPPTAGTSANTPSELWGDPRQR